jgi:hypothetical protein
MNNTILIQSRWYPSDSLSKAWYLHDPSADENGHKILERYIRDAHSLFAEKAASLMNFEKAFTLKEEKRLESMLKLLIDARKTWEGGSR